MVENKQILYDRQQGIFLELIQTATINQELDVFAEIGDHW